MHKSKIGCLPAAVQDELNERLSDNDEDAAATLAWLNGLPAVQAMLEGRFQSQPINRVNLLLWRKTGLPAWVRGRERSERLRELERFAGEYGKNNHAALVDGAAALASAKVLELLELMDDDPADETPAPESAGADPDEVAAGKSAADAGNAVEKKRQRAVDQLAKVARTLRALRAMEHAAERLKQQDKRIKLAEEKLSIERDQSEREIIDLCAKALKDARAKEIEANEAISYEQRIEILGQHIFGDLWKPRNIPGVVSLSPEQAAALAPDAPTAAVPAAPGEDGPNQAEGEKQQQATAEARPANDIQSPTSKDHDLVNHADRYRRTPIKTKDEQNKAKDSTCPKPTGETGPKLTKVD